jgi:two-component system, OmpR family, KDP operon response regulator KdpE
VTPRVLVVEDDADFRRLMTRMLEGWGHAVVEAGSVCEALAHASELHPDTIVTDVGLPDGDGFALARQLADLPWNPRVIIISSDDDVGHVREAQRAGAVAFLCKDAGFRVAIRRLLNPSDEPGGQPHPGRR